MLTTIGFDADDTLWQNERYYRAAEAEFASLLANYADVARLERALNERQRLNTPLFGFGAKSFTLSMIETAIELSGGGIPASALQKIIATGRDMLAHPVELLPHAREAVESLAARYRVVLITKGDLLHQERKIAASLMGGLFERIEIVSDKKAETYARIFSETGDGPGAAMMVGNSMKSDVIPAIEAGAFGVYIPHEHTWALERAEPPGDASRYRELASIGDLPSLVCEISGEFADRTISCGSRL